MLIKTYFYYILSTFKQSKAVLRKIKTELSVTQNKFVIKLVYTVETGGSDSSVSIN
jgi:hypothetical protein